MNERPQTGGVVALAATLAIQIYVSLAASATAVLAPVIAPEFRVSPKLIGPFIGLLYLGSMFASLVSGALIARYGAIRLSQACVLVCLAGLLLLPVASLLPFGVAVLAIAPLVIGAGYGPITPASSQVLARTAPPSRLALTFSIKQTGVPAGAALGGALLPTLTLAVGWRIALAIVAAFGIVVMLAAQPIRSDLDRGRDRHRRGLSLRGMFAPVRGVLASEKLRELTIIAFFYASMQVSLTSYLVVFLADALGQSLLAAGFGLAVATVGGVAGRIAWGVVADRYLRPRTVLGLIGLAAGACSLATAAFPPTGSSTALLVLCAAFGATAIGWNGVQLAELARHAPAGQAAAVTGAAGFIGFAGVMLGPPLFGLLATLTGDYRAGFVAMGMATLACGGWTLRRGDAAR